VPRTARLWLRHPVQSARWLWHATSARAGATARLRMPHGWEVVCHPAAVPAFAFERDEPELRAELDAFVAACAEGMVLFDIGAHYGLFTLAALHYGGAAARVVALDPSDAAAAVFDENVRLARGTSRVVRHRAAAGATAGETSLLSGGAGAWHMMVAPGEARADVVTVPVLTIDGLVRDSGLVPTHVKIDVEGQEDAVLRGADATLRGARPIVFLELHGGIIRRAGGSPVAVLERLRAAGYHSLAIAGRPVSAEDAAAQDVARIECRT